MNDDLNDFATFLSYNNIIDSDVIKQDSDEGFSNRLKLQKLVFIAQECFNLNLGFNFSIYRYGPYSPQLANYYFSDAFEFVPNHFRIPEEFDKERFLSIVNGKEDEWFEVAATLIDTKKYYPQSEVVQAVSNIKPRYSNEYIKSVYDYLELNNLMGYQ